MISRISWWWCRWQCTNYIILYWNFMPSASRSEHIRSDGLNLGEARRKFSKRLLWQWIRWESIEYNTWKWWWPWKQWQRWHIVYCTVETIAIVKGEHQWGLQLTDILIDSGRESDRAKELRGICLRCCWKDDLNRMPVVNAVFIQVLFRKLAGREVSAPGMNWWAVDEENVDLFCCRYLTEDLVQEGLQIRSHLLQIFSQFYRFSIQAKPTSHCSTYLCRRHVESFQVRSLFLRCHIDTMKSTFRMLTVMLDSDATQNVNSSCLFRSSSPTCNYIHPGPE